MATSPATGAVLKLGAALPPCHPFHEFSLRGVQYPSALCNACNNARLASRLAGCACHLIGPKPWVGLRFERLAAPSSRRFLATQIGDRTRSAPTPPNTRGGFVMEHGELRVGQARLHQPARLVREESRLPPCGHAIGRIDIGVLQEAVSTSRADRARERPRRPHKRGVRCRRTCRSPTGR
jgi:hypothetical protein